MIKKIVNTVGFLAVLLTSYSIAISNWTAAFYSVSLIGLAYSFGHFEDAPKQQDKLISIGLLLIILGLCLSLYALLLGPLWSMLCLCGAMLTTVTGLVLSLNGYFKVK